MSLTHFFELVTQMSLTHFFELVTHLSLTHFFELVPITGPNNNVHVQLYIVHCTIVYTVM